MRALALVVLFAGCQHLPVAHDASTESLKSAALASSGAYDVAFALSTAHPARITGSPSEAAAQQWAMQKMRALGFDEVRLEPVEANGWFRGEESVTLNGTRVLKAASLGLTPPTPGDGVEGEVLEIDDETGKAAADGPKAEGKVLFWNNAPMERTKDFSGYGKAVAVRRAAAMLCARLGALGVVFRSVTSADDDLPHTGSPGQGITCPTFALGPQSAAALHEAVRAGGARLKLVSHARNEPVKTANVVGEIRGRVHPEQVVLLGAHLDSWDLASGAVDDAAGVGIVLEVGRLMAALPQRPDRTLRVVLFTNEESGTAGGKAYAQAHATDQHVLAMESDAGTDEVDGIAFRIAESAFAIAQQMAKPLELMGIERLIAPAHGGADLGPLGPTGVPMIDLRQKVDRYFDFHHAGNDQPSALNASALRQVVAAYVAVTTQVLHSSDTLGPAPAPEH